MRSVYEAANAIDAQIVADVLAGEGIDAVVTGAGLVGAAGELPALGLVNVNVADEDATRARLAIRAWEAAKPPPDEDASRAAPAPARARGRLSFLAGAAIGALVTYTVVHGWPFAIENTGHEPGRMDRRIIEEGGRVVRVETDRNGDGRMDDIARFGENDGDSVIEEDDDFDGVFEHETRIVDYVLVSVSGDHDGDGYKEYHASYRFGAKVTETWADPVARRIVKRTTHDGVSATSSEIDSDGDGRLDRRRRYDRRGEIVTSEAM